MLENQKASKVKSYYPRDIAIDTANNRIAVADYWKPSVQFYDLDLGWLKEIGGSTGTRMTGAHEAIQAITSDPSLKAGVYFGFGWWSSQWKGWIKMVYRLEYKQRSRKPLY